MQKIGVHIILLAFLTSSYTNVFIVTSFLVRLDYFSTELCELRDQPELGCNGTCQLAKMLENEENQDTQLPAVNQFLFEAVSDFEEVAIHPIPYLDNKNHVTIFSFLGTDLVEQEFHPPEYLS